MHVAPVQPESQATARGWRRPCSPICSVGLALVVLALTSGELMAGAADVADTANGAAPSADFLERTNRRQAAAQRIDELEQETWKFVVPDGDFASATASMSRAADLARSEFGAEHWLTKLKESLATGLKSLAKLPEAQRQLFIEAAKSQSLSGYLWSNGKRDGALAQIRQSRNQRDQAVGSEHILSAYFLLGLAYNECQMGDFRSGQRDAEAAVGVVKAAWGEKNPGYAHALFYQAIAEAGLRDHDQAEQHFREALAILEPVAREGISNHFLQMYASVQLQLARLLNAQERFADAEPFARRGSEILGFAPRQSYTNYLEGQLDLARSLSGQGKDAEAEILFTCLIRSVQPNPPPHVMAHILALYAEHLRRVNRESDAEQLETLIRKISATSAGPKSIDERASEAVPLADIPKGAKRK